VTGIWAGVVGEDQAVARLEAAAEVPVHAYLFVGPPGSTKREAARAFAAALLCERGRGCGECRACRLALAGAHPDLHEVERVGPAITSGQADEIVRQASLVPIEGERKVLVLHEFHLLAPVVAPKLLKTIEEPPPSTVFVVLADDVPPDLVTIASRCVRVDFRPLPESVLLERLVEEGADPEAAAVAARAAAGDLDRARVLASDPEVAARREAFRRVPHRLDGTGITVVSTVEELLGLIDAAAAPLKARQAGELADVERRERQLDLDLGAERKRLADRHKRELRRHRRDELEAGLAALAGTYRDLLVDGKANDPAAAYSAIEGIHEAIENLERNPNEHLLLQALLLNLPGV